MERPLLLLYAVPQPFNNKILYDLQGNYMEFVTSFSSFATSPFSVMLQRIVAWKALSLYSLCILWSPSIATVGTFIIQRWYIFDVMVWFDLVRIMYK